MNSRQQVIAAHTTNCKEDHIILNEEKIRHHLVRCFENEKLKKIFEVKRTE